MKAPWPDWQETRCELQSEGRLRLPSQDFGGCLWVIKQAAGFLPGESF